MQTSQLYPTTDAHEREYAAGDDHGRRAARGWVIRYGQSPLYRDHYPVGAPWTQKWSRAYAEGHRDGWDVALRIVAAE